MVTAGMHLLLGWSVLGAAFSGVLIAATDPVSVIAAFKEMKAEHRLSMVVKSESLLNEGVAAVGFAILVGIATGGALTASGASLALLWTVAGGVAIGAVIGMAVLTIAGRTTDHLIEVTLTTVVAWGSFLLAEHVHASGVFAALAAGLIIGNVGPRGSISIDDAAVAPSLASDGSGRGGTLKRPEPEPAQLADALTLEGERH